MPRAQRKGISDREKKALRAWFSAQYPQPRHADCIAWFEQQYQHKINQSTVSSILSNRYKHLDSQEATLLQRHANPQWPILESILYEWQLQITQSGGFIDGDILLMKAAEIWKSIPQYQDLPLPRFSQGWLSRFKARHSIRYRIQHGEASSVPISAHEEMKSVRTLCGEFLEEDIYNMDESGLFWRRSPHSGLSSYSQPGIKKDKTRVSIVVCTNCSGTDRVPIWVIGHAKTPRALRNINLRALECYWQYNKKAWMNSLIMREWLQFFYHHVGSNRRILLLMDNFSAHKAGVELAPPPTNIQIQYLPANSTSVFQPLDQGIIQNLKYYYRKQWLQYIIEYIELGQDPTKTVNLHYAIRWLTQAWRNDVANATIYKCFRKSTIITPTIPHLTAPEAPDLTTLYSAVEEVSGIQHSMSIENFLNPEDENVIEKADENELMASLLADYLPQVNEEALEELDNEVIEAPEPITSIPEAIRGIRAALSCAERQDGISPRDIRELERLERLFGRLTIEKQHQTTLDSFWNS
jgi:hypothetical protein